MDKIVILILETCNNSFSTLIELQSVLPLFEFVLVAYD